MSTGPARRGERSRKARSRLSFASAPQATIPLIALIALLGCRAQASGATAFSPATFQSPDGALTLTQGGNYVEPYFATKALMVAQDGGMDRHDASCPWIDWAWPRQRRGG